MSHVFRTPGLARRNKLIRFPSAAPPGGQTVELGLASETDIGLVGSGLIKTAHLGLAQEADTAQPVSVVSGATAVLTLSAATSETTVAGKSLRINLTGATLIDEAPSHFEITPAAIMIDWGAFGGSPVWPQTESLPWDNTNFDNTPAIVASPSLSGNGALMLSPLSGSIGSIRVRSSNEYPSFDYAISNTTLGIWVRIDFATEPAGNEIIQVYMPDTATTNGSTTNSDAVYYNENYLVGGYEYQLVQGWNYLKFSTADVDYGTDNDPVNGDKPVPHYITRTFGTGGTPGTNLKSMQISLANFSTGDVVYLDRIEKDQKSESVVMFGFDGNSADLITKAKSRLDLYGYGAYFAVTEANTDTSTETDRGDTLVAAGWDALAHTRTHANLATATQDDPTVHAEVGWSLDRVDELVWTPHEKQHTFLYPDNESLPAVAERIARLFSARVKLARARTGRWTHFHPLANDQLVPNPMHIGTFAMDQGHTLNQMKAVIDYAELLGTSIVFTGHIFDDGSPPNDPDTAPADPLAIFTDHWDALVDYANARDTGGAVRVLTPSRAMELAQFGEFGKIRRDVINLIDGDLSQSTSWDAVRQYIPATAVTRVSATEISVALDALYGILNIATDETLTSGDLLSSWTQEVAGNVPVSGSVVITAVAGQIVLLGLATEADMAFDPGLLLKTALMGIATGSDTGLPIVASKPFLLGLANEIDQGQNIATTAAVALAQAVEADTANVIVAAKAATLGLSGETDSALTIAVGASVSLGLAEETGSGLPLSHARATQIGLAQESDAALSFILNQVRVLGLASETDSGLLVAPTKAAMLGMAQESAQGLAMALGKGYTVGIATESDSAFTISVSGGVAGPSAITVAYTIQFQPAHYTIQ